MAPQLSLRGHAGRRFSLPEMKTLRGGVMVVMAVVMMMSACSKRGACANQNQEGE
jgi:hypothetical protein